MEEEKIVSIETLRENAEKSKKDEKAFVSFMEDQIKTYNDPGDMMNLGGYYYGIKNFEKALEYYEMAAECDYDPAYEGLGYIWYYGRTGEKNYKKAYKYFSKLMEKGNITASYKIADMYKNGYYVEKNQEKYEEIIEELFEKVKKDRNLFTPVPEVFTRLAKIEVSRGNKLEAVDLYRYSRDFLAQRLWHTSFFGDLSIMKWLIDDLYELVEFDPNSFGFYDMYYLFKSEHKISFDYLGDIYYIESKLKDGVYQIKFDGKVYKDRDDFFNNAMFKGEKITKLQRDFEDFKLIK